MADTLCGTGAARWVLAAPCIRRHRACCLCGRLRPWTLQGFERRREPGIELVLVRDLVRCAGQDLLVHGQNGLLDVFLGDLGVDFGRRDEPMAQQVANLLERQPLRQPMRCSAVSQGVGRDLPFREELRMRLAGRLDVLVQDSRDTVARERAARRLANMPGPSRQSGRFR